MELFEALEKRAMLSVSLSAGILNIKGTAGTDLCQVFYSAALKKIAVSMGSTGKPAAAFSFDPKKVKQIKALMGGGNDLVGVAGIAKVPVYFDGGAGNDTLSLGSMTAACKIYGGLGNDVLNGGLGNDLINGGAGNDRLFGNAGKDNIIGGAGQDYISAGGGNDVINAKDGEMDDIVGGTGNDKATIDKVSGTQTPNETGVGNDIETVLG